MKLFIAIQSLLTIVNFLSWVALLYSKSNWPGRVVNGLAAITTCSLWLSGLMAFVTFIALITGV